MIVGIIVTFLILNMLAFGLNVQPTRVGPPVHSIDTGGSARITMSSTSTVFSEDFEGAFPADNWSVGDENSNNDLDYWDDTSYRWQAGSWSGWCAQIGSQTSTTIILNEDFEGVFPGSWTVEDFDSASGNDLWDDTSYRSYGGSWSAWCAEIGTKVTSTTTIFYEDFEGAWPGSWSVFDSNEADGYDYWGDYYDTTHPAHQGSWDGYCADEGAHPGCLGYDNNMDAYMYRSVNLAGYSSATLSYYYWLDSESGYDYLYVTYFDGSWHDIGGHTGSSGGWQSSSVSIPTSASYVGFHFSSDSSVCNYEGAYIDKVTLTGAADVPNTSLHMYDDYMDAYMVRKYAIDASTWVSATLYYWAWYETEVSFDYCQVIATDDAGANWYYIGEQLTGTSGWSYHSLPVPDTYLTSLFNIGFMFHSDGSNHNYEGVYLDDIVLEYVPDTTPPPAPVISSPTHTNEDEWFSNNDPTFEWTTPPDPSGIEGYSYTLDHSPSTTPDTTVDTTENSARYFDIADGEWWFHVRAKDNADNWGSPDHYRVRVDTIPPSSFITHAPGSASVYVEAADPLPGSGVYAIYVRIDSGDWTEYLGAGPIEILLAGTGSHFIETYSKDNANPRNSESPLKSLAVHYLLVNTNPPGFDNPAGEGWFDEGTEAQVNVDNVAGYIFEYWYLDGQVDSPYSTSMSTSIILDEPHTLTAKFAIVGDVNRNGIVDISDGVLVAAASGARLITDPGDPRFGEYWHDEACPRCPHNPHADINQDGVIDDLDLEIVEDNLGRTE